MNKVLVLGAGMVGATIANDLAEDFEVTVADCNHKSLQNTLLDNVAGKICLSLDGLEKHIKDFDIVVGALPGRLGYKAALMVLTQGKHYVDISFAPEDISQLNEVAKKNGAICFYDFGLAPGLSHMFFGRTQSAVYKLIDYKIYVGGLVDFPEPPLYYKSTFSPTDVLAEYIRKARFIHNGIIRTVPALSDLEIVKIGDKYYEAFLTDGVRSLLKHKDVNIVEKTLRTPGHASEVLRYKSLGDNGVNALKALLKGCVIREEDRDTTVMQVEVTWEDEPSLIHQNIVKWKQVHTLHDHHDGEKTSMARTTGFTCAAGVRAIAGGHWNTPGVHPPEKVGMNYDCYNLVIQQLKSKGIVIKSLRSRLY